MADDQTSPVLIADVILDQKLPIVLSYSVPEHLKDQVKEGQRCQIPFQNRTIKGFIFDVKTATPSFSLKPILEISDQIKISKKLLDLCLWMSKYYVTPLSKVLHHFVPKLVKQESLEISFSHYSLKAENKDLILDFLQTHHKRKKKLLNFVNLFLEADTPFATKDVKKQLGKELFNDFEKNNWLIGLKKTSKFEFERITQQKKQLTDEQKKASGDLIFALKQKAHSLHLLFGVCGSGKTEVYFEVIEEALKLGLGVIYMVPEVSIAPQTLKRLKSRFSVPIALIHHQVSDGIKRQDYEGLSNGSIKLVLGARSAIFAPMQNLGLVIIDEEHESAYKQEGMPTYHAKDVAIMRARLENAMVIMGSATPSLETYYQTTQNKITLHTLKSRPKSYLLPDINLAPLGTEFQKAQGLNLFAEEPLKALVKNFEKGEQSLIFINRRGYHALQQCSSCAEAIKCKNCSIAMTHHKKDALLICHFCGYETPPPKTCPLCGSETMQFKGFGTQAVEARLQMLLKEARILRVDKDTTSKKGSLDNYFELFSSHGADILIGTQMIAKGLDFSSLTLAIILNIDGTFNRPDFRAHEEAFQLMTQVAGRAGRSVLPGTVYIQSVSPDHPLCLLAKRGDYEAFYEREIEERKLYSYPPFARLTRFVFSGTDKASLENYGQNFRNLLKTHLSEDYFLEPLVSCFHEMIDNHYRFHFMIKGKTPIRLYEIIEKIDKKLKPPTNAKRLIDVDPQSTYF